MRPFSLRRSLRYQGALAALGLAVLVSGCTGLPGAQPRQLDRTQFARIDAAIDQAIAERRLPGAVFHLEREGAVHERAYGRFSYEADDGADPAPVTTHTVFDAASLSKVLATAPSVLLLAEDGKLDLDAKLVDYFPECRGGGKEAITIRHLLTHTSGLAAGLPGKPAWRGDETAHAMACAQTVTHVPGTYFRYSDINYILLGQLVRQVSGMGLDVFARERLFGPLRMAHTGYLPLRRMDAGAIAPTHKAAAVGEPVLHADVGAGGMLQGVVHDPTARRIGGVAGSAGVFSTVGDIARYARMLLAGGELDGVRVLSPESVRLLTTVQSPPGIAALRGLGMDIDSPFAQRPRGTLFPVGSYGHTGFTGCVLWIDPGSRSFYVFLSNRVYPDDKANVLPLYTEIATLAARAAGVGATGGVRGVAAP
ncbi:serine hydrolase domain-containing protein [Massilia litorea]|uniref:Beta-lactamase family protein n=1 Tax=Massilia litorea TaxID=2769491 RepID=A0A7L9U893_9BURK|nr:serine hydrolase domain-containing protein [Massilia litorea]QOL50306.1 beta-lactamase family protein [Massilia litorea]